MGEQNTQVWAAAHSRHMLGPPVRDPINRGGKGHGHESGGTCDPISHGGKGNKEIPGQPGGPGTTETETKN
ncbi:hypothetical protein Pyn_17948 [Prunus yedoensis var. nudiflora]|uniref:Uncharacterized protein n=1 Tax=Prunus yedoensis var. nudiflora TaxID=2094558 RepID=A0A314YSU4_PRUYE|nr:hypothetical protein Pyn_17948 [Prunus yedoensis var. nudiflora]